MVDLDRDKTYRDHETFFNVFFFVIKFFVFKKIAAQMSLTKFFFYNLLSSQILQPQILRVRTAMEKASILEMAFGQS